MFETMCIYIYTYICICIYIYIYIYIGKFPSWREAALHRVGRGGGAVGVPFAYGRRGKAVSRVAVWVRPSGAQNIYTDGCVRTLRMYLAYVPCVGTLRMYLAYVPCVGT